ncbi:hypothetical protein [Streptomyces collinus]
MLADAWGSKWTATGKTVWFKPAGDDGCRLGHKHRGEADHRLVAG